MTRMITSSRRLTLVRILSLRVQAQVSSFVASSARHGLDRSGGQALDGAMAIPSNPDDLSPYARQLCLSEIGEAGQRRLLASRVLVVGAGGLGAPVLSYLVGGGVGFIGIVDDDQVELTNLQRQVLFTHEDLGKNKAQVSSERLQKLNPQVQFKVYPERLNAIRIAEWIGDYDCIVDGTDNFETKFLLNDAAVKFDKPLVYGSIQKFEGQVAVFNLAGGPCYRCLYPEPPKAQIQNCAEAGVLGAVAGVIGSLQALETIKVLLNDAKQLPVGGSVLTFDGIALQSRSFRIPKRADCAVCSRSRGEIVLRDAESVCWEDRAPEIDAEQLLDLLEAPHSQLLDVREAAELTKGMIEGASTWPLTKLQAGEWPPLKVGPVILYCQSGVRSQKAAALLIGHGFNEVYSLRSGFAGWTGRIAINDSSTL